MNSPYYKPYWLNDDELEHYGVKGMKWGIRRYQNADGTLTEAGKKRAHKYVRYDVKQAQRYYTKSEKMRQKLQDVPSNKKLTKRIMAYDAQIKGDYYQSEARRIIDAIYPNLKDVSWNDVEKDKIYLSYLDRKKK